MTEAVCFSETLVFTYKSTRRYNPENQDRYYSSRPNICSWMRRMHSTLGLMCGLGECELYYEKVHTDDEKVTYIRMVDIAVSVHTFQRRIWIP
jgi:hypothetical protein